MDLLIIFAIVYFLRNAVTDAKYAALGKTPPRYQMKLSQLAAAGKSGAKPRYGSREYFADLWSDGLEASTERRRAKAAGRKGAELDTAVGEALAVAAPDEDDEWMRPLDLVIPGETRTTCRTCGRPIVVTNYDEEGGAAYCVLCVEVHSAAVIAAHKPPAAEPVPAGPDAQVIQMFPTPKKEVPAMSEVTGLQSAIAYAQQVAGAHASHSTAGGETYINSLAGYNVTGVTIQTVAEAQAASANAAAMWSKAAGELSKQLVVKEAYDNTPDAGTQAFVQGE